MNGYPRELNLIFDRALARSNLSYLQCLADMGREPPKVRWMPRRWRWPWSRRP